MEILAKTSRLVTVSVSGWIIRFVNENNEVTTAEEMKKALESHGGLRGCRVAVVDDALLTGADYAYG